MSDDVFDFIVGFAIVLILLFVGGVLGWTITENHTDQMTKNKIVCTQYLHGTWHSNICVVNGKVVSVR